jgi:hypothetical protein
MKKNMGKADRIVRIIVAIILGVLYYNGTISGTWAIVALVVAVIFALTSFVSTCPLYSIVGISTCKVKD